MGEASGLLKKGGGKKADSDAAEFSFKLTLRVPDEVLAQFSRQLAVLLQSGVPLPRSILLLSSQTTSTSFRDALQKVYVAINNGQPLSAALGKHPLYFSRLYINMLRVGETHGDIAHVMHNLADFQEREFDLRRRIRQAMSYPTLILGLSLTFTFFIFNFILPYFVNVFDSLHVELPLLSRILVALVRLSNEPVAAFFTVCLLGGGFYILRCYVASEDGRYRQDRLKLRLPLVGPLVKKISVGRVARSLSLLLGAGVHMEEALDLSALVCGNAVYERQLDASRVLLTQGEPLSRVFAHSQGLFPNNFVQMVLVGEESGKVDELLSRIAEMYEMDVDNAFGVFAAAIEPLLVLFTGVVVGLIVLAVFLPLYSYINQL